MPCDDSGGAADLWAMAAELERQFAGYKQRLAERTATGGATATPREHHDAGDGDGAAGEEEEEEGIDGEAGGGGDVRGRVYEAYVRRRRDERLRDGWRARMERKEAEVKALWAQLQLAAAGSAGTAGGGADRAHAAAGGDPTTTTAATATAEDGDERKTGRNGDDRRRSSSDAALAPRRITGKKHARTRSFSSSITTTRNRTDVGRRRALSQEPPTPSEPDTSRGEAIKESRAWPACGAAGATTATTRPRTSLRRRSSSVKGHGSAKQAGAGTKLPRSLPRRDDSSGGPEDLVRDVAPAVVQPSAEAVAPPVPSRSTEYAAPGGDPRDSPPRMSFAGRDDSSSGGTGTGAANARATSPEPDRGAVDEAVSHGEPEAKDDAGVEEHGEEKKVDADGEVTSDSEPEPSYVYVNKDAAEEQAMATLSEPSKLAGSDAAVHSDVKASEETAAAPAPAEATAAAAEIATTNAEEAPARESSDESSLSVRSSVPSARPSCSSRERDQSIERRLLEADAALARKKREERAEKSAAPAPRTPPGSAGSRFSSTVRSPRGTAVRGFKRFLSFGKKHRGREVTVIDCTSPSVPSPADDDSGSTSGRWQPAGGSIKPRIGSSDATSDDTDHAYPVFPQACSLQTASPAKSELAEIVPQEKSPKVHRSFFSFRSLNCGRG